MSERAAKMSQSCDATEPIAIVGMAMRFPGGSHSGEQFWDMLSKGRSAHSRIPKERYDMDGYYHPDNARAGAINVKGAYFLSESATLFDAPFFSMTANEAMGTDPQQRLMMEVAYEALENAGIPMRNVIGSDTSVYVGCFTRDWEAVSGRDPYGGPFYAATGNGQSMLSNRVSWFFDLRGPSMTIDTACSSSLYAIHLACQSLKLGECKMALIGGTNLIADCSYIRDAVTMGFFSPDGICHSFDHRANGYARGDGIGGMVLKTLSQALADGDTIRAVIRNTGLNQDGKTPGITMPSPQMQAELIRSTYAAAGLDLKDTAYFEAHGTGTQIGDPYELSALGATFGQSRSPENPIWVGSVKTNIGHLEGCAGIAGVIKSVLVLERGMIPPLAGFEKVNPKLRLDEWRVALPEKLTPWPAPGLRRASVNSFGYGGSNAHIIVDDAYNYLKERGLDGNHQTQLHALDAENSDSGFSSEATSEAEDGFDGGSPAARLFVISSSDQAGLQRMQSTYASFLDDKLAKEKEEQTASLVDWKAFISNLAFTLGSRRSALDHRSFVVAKSASDLSQQLQGTMPKLRRTAKNNNIMMVFTGQGAQWPAMGAQLISHKVYRDSLARAQATLDREGCTWSVVDELHATKESSRIDNPEFSQPLCTALQVALVDLLSSWGVTPKSVVGHSSGEIGAAYAARHITHENAMKVAYWRGVYSADINNRLDGKTGSMMAVGLSEAAAKTYLAKVEPDSVVVACINAPTSVTLSGDESVIDHLESVLKADGVFARKLRVQAAYHSPHVKVVAEDYLRSMGTLEPPAPTDAEPVTMFSSVEEAPITAKELGPAYWVKNMVNPVRFLGAVKALVTQPVAGKGRRKAFVPYSAMIECGPAEALKGPLTQILSAVDERLVSSVPYTSMLSRGADAEVTALAAAGRLWAQGLNVDLMKVNGLDKKNENHQSLASLPPYPWNHSKAYLHESGWGKKYRYKSKPRTDLLGMRLENQDPTEPRWHNYVRLSEQPWLVDHKVQQMTLYPGAAMVVMALEAARELVDPKRTLKALEARNVQFKRGIVVPGRESSVETAIHLRPISERTNENRISYGFKVLSQEEGQEWAENCTGSVEILYDGEGAEASESIQDWTANRALYADIKKRATKTIAPKTYYKLFDRKMNLQYGPLHQGVTECVAGIGEGYGTVTIPDTKAVMPCQFEFPHLIHPSTLDAVFHMQALGYLHTLSGEESLVPIGIDSIYVSADVACEPGSMFKGYSKGTQSENGDSVGDIVLSDDQWSSPKVIVRGFFAQDLSVANTQSAAADSRPRKCTTIEWVELDEEAVATPAMEAEEGEILVVAEPEEINLPEILILYKEDASEEVKFLAENLSMQLSGPKCHVKLVTFADLTRDGAVDANEKNIISLLEAETPFIKGWSEEDFTRFKSLALQATSLLWITRGGESVAEKDLNFSLATGLMRTIRVERPQMKLPHLDLSANIEIDGEITVELIIRAFKSTILNEDDSIEQEFVEQGGKLFVPRVTSSDSFHAELGRELLSPAATLQVLSSAKQPLTAVLGEDGKSLHWTQHKGRSSPIGQNEVEVKVQAASLEAGELAANCAFGNDLVGTVAAVGSDVKNFAAGDLVVACAPALKSIVRSPQDLVRKVPEGFTVAQAALMPSALCTAQMALIDSAHLQKDETVLISATPGPIGYALIALAKHVGAEVYVTSDSSSHSAYLKANFEIADNHILKAVADEPTPFGIKADVVVNALNRFPSEELLSSLDDFGRFISVESSATGTCSSVRVENGTFSIVRLGHLRKTFPKRFASLLSRAWSETRMPLLSKLHPTTFACTDFEGASGNLHGADAALGTVVTFADEDVVSILPSKPVKLKLDPAATYILSGGFGGIGRSIAEMMFLAGARNISFISRSGASSAEAKQLLSSFEARGCNAKAYCCDIASATAVESFVKECEQRGETIKGLVQCAMVLRDSMFENMTFEQWQQSTAPKVLGTFNLHKYMPRNIDFFIMLSSMAGVIGSPGQANYSASGTYQDALSLHRRAQGLASTTIDLGIASDVGYLAENPDALARFDYLEPLFISERDIHSMLSAVMLGQTRDGNVVPSQVVTGIGKELTQDGSIGAAMAADRKYAHLADSASSGGAGDSSEDEEIKAGLKAAETLRDGSAIVEGVLASQIAKALTMEKEDVDLEKPMHSYGVDSLVAVEVRNMIFRRLKSDISVFDILSSMPVNKLAIKVLSKSKLARPEVAALAQSEIAD